eukprot:TRINITY_DN6627_c0_g1_i5.p1 TRINITY_DN6627_c0_g1~~TRINITY_DN6627_c0_g1_i5.p1  ORF type:complete len:1980 (+),score=399.62 TRINITY_DN6627_c0_g1_i5:597-6536(+)
MQPVQQEPERCLAPSEIQSIISGPDSGFEEHKAALLRACMLAPGGAAAAAAAATGPSTAQQLLYLQWVLSPVSFGDDVLEARANQVGFVQEILKQGVVASIVQRLRELLQGMLLNPTAAGLEPPEDCVHLVASLVGITQRCQLTSDEVRQIFLSLNTCLQVLEGQSMSSAGGASNPNSGPTLAGAPVPPRLRFPPGTPGALIEDVAYLISISLINALRVPLPDTMYLWCRDKTSPNRDTNSLLGDTGFVGELSQLCVRSPGGVSGGNYVVDKIRNVGQGDRRSRDEAAGYYAMVMIGVSAFLLSETTTAAGVAALKMACKSIGSIELGSRVVARCNWKGGAYSGGVVRAIRDSGAYVVAFDEGEEEAVLAAHVRIETSQELSGRGWLRVKNWFPSFFSCGMGTIVSEETIIQCIATSMDCWLAKTMCVIVDELLSAEQEEYRIWDENVKQPGALPSSLGTSSDIPAPECHILVDILRSIAFSLSPTETPDSEELRIPQGWRTSLINSIIQYSKSEGVISTPRAGVGLFCRFVRKAHGVQGPIAWLVEASHGGQGDLDPTALEVLGAYLDLCKSLCTDDVTCKEIFSMLQTDADMRSTYHISLRFIIADPDTSVVGSLVNSTGAWTEKAEQFLVSTLGLLTVMVTRSPQVRSEITQHAELQATCFTRLFSILEKSVGGVVVGKTFEVLSSWVDGHESAVHIWLKIYRGGVIPFQQSLDPSAAYMNPTGYMQQSPIVNQVNQVDLNAQIGGMEYELSQERRQRRYPLTIGFLTLLFKLLNSVNWRVCSQHDLPVHELAVVYIKWVLESILAKWDEQRYDTVRERWAIIMLVLRIIRAGVQIPETRGPIDPTTSRTRSPQTVIWMAVVHGDLLTKLMSITMERRERERRTGAVMDNVLAEGLATIYVVLHNADSPVATSICTTQQGKIAQDVADWDNGGLVMKLSSEEWHGITLNAHFPYQISKYCLLILLELAQAGCRLSHHFIASDRGRPEDITRDAEQTLLTTAKSTHRQLLAKNQPQLAQALDKFVIRPLEAGRRVGGLMSALRKYLIAPIEQVLGYAREAAELRNTLQIFEDNKAEKVQEVLAAVLGGTPQHTADNRRLLVCDILYKTLELGTGYYNLAHILCGIPERYVEARARRIPTMSEDKVLRPFGTLRRTCLSVLVERLSEPDSSFVKSDPVAATEYLRVLAHLASDRVVGRAVLRYLRSINLVDRLLGLLREKLCELPVRPSSVPDPTNLAREFRICASILQLAALELFTNNDASAQNHILKLLVTTQESHHPLLLEAIRSLDLESLPVPAKMSELLSLPVAITFQNRVPQYSLESLEDVAGMGPMGVEAYNKSKHSNLIVHAYTDIVAYVEAWSRLADVTLVTVGTDGAETDEVLFQTLHTLVNQMASNLSKQKAMQQLDSPIESHITQQRTIIDSRLSRTAISLIDAIHSRTSARPARSPEQLGHLLRPLLQCICNAADKDLRTNLYIVLTAFLHNVESTEIEIGAGRQGLRQHDTVDRARIACRDEFLQNPHGLLSRMKADAGSTDSCGALMTAAWTTLATTVEWDEHEQFVAELHGSNLIALHLTSFDKILCDVLRVAGHGDTTGSQYLGGYQAFMCFLLTYASTGSGSRALIEHHGFLTSLKNCSFLSMCGNGFRSTSELLTERCAQIALPALRVVCAVTQQLSTDHSVIAQVQDFIYQQGSLFDFILRRPFHLHNAQDSIDITSLSLLETATQLLSMYTASGAPCSLREAPRLVEQYQLRSVLAEFSSRAAWTRRLQQDAVEVGEEGRDKADAVKDEADTLVRGIVYNVLSCMRRVCEVRSAGVDFHPIFELTVHDPEAVSSETVISRIDLTIILCMAKDLLGNGQYDRRAGCSSKDQPGDALLILRHFSILETLLLLLYHLRGASEPRFRSQAKQYVGPLLQDITEYTITYEAVSRHDPVTIEVISSISAVVKVVAEVLSVPLSKLEYSTTGILSDHWSGSSWD